MIRKHFIVLCAFVLMSTGLHAQFGLGKLTSKATPAAAPAAPAQPADAQSTAPATATTPSANSQTTATLPASAQQNTGTPTPAAPPAPATPAKSSFSRFMSAKAAPSAAPVAGQTVALVKLITVATDQGMVAMDILARVFPPEKVAAYEAISKKYHDSTTSRKNGDIDSEQYGMANDAAAEIAKLSVEWSSYRKDQTKFVPMADHRLAYMLLADGLALTQVPGALTSVENDVKSMMSNPLQIGKAKQLQVTVMLFTNVGKQMPRQVESFKTVRGIVKNIATAEHMTLAPDPAPGTLKDPVSAVAAINKELPPDDASTSASAPIAPAAVAPASSPSTPTAPAAQPTVRPSI